MDVSKKKHQYSFSYSKVSCRASLARGFWTHMVGVYDPTRAETKKDRDKLSLSYKLYKTTTAIEVV